METKESQIYVTAADAIDYKGLPADRSRTGGWIPAISILGVEFCERLTTLGIAVNLVTYLMGTLHLSSATSSNVVTDFMGTSFLLCLFGGFIADSFLGRYRTILIFAVVQALGNAMLAISTKLPPSPPCHDNIAKNCEKATSFQISMLYTSLYLVAVGTGGLKSSVSGFGSDQFDENDEKEKLQLAYFFSRLFFFINLGTLIAVTVLVYIEDEVGRSWAYGICAVFMFVAILMFLSGTKRYRYKKSIGSPLVQILQVIVAATRKRNLPVPSEPDLLYEDTPGCLRVLQTNQFSFLDKAAIITKEDYRMGDDAVARYPWKLSTVTRVEEVKMMIRLLPIWATTIIFWTTYAQILTFSVQQASTMKRSIGDFLIPAASLNVFFVLGTLISLAFYDRVIMPLWTAKKGQPGFTNLQNIGIGLVLSIFAMVAAALAEIKRLSVARKVSTTAPANHHLPISVFILIPQFFLVGSGVAFTYTGQLDFFITQSPKGMKTLSTGLFLTTLSLGFFVSSLLVSIVKKVTRSRGGQGWVGEHINNGRLDCFYGLLAIICVINFVLYLVCVTWYKSHKPQVLKEKNVVKGSKAEVDC